MSTMTAGDTVFVAGGRRPNEMNTTTEPFEWV